MPSRRAVARLRDHRLTARAGRREAQARWPASRWTSGCSRAIQRSNETALLEQQEVRHRVLIRRGKFESVALRQLGNMVDQGSRGRKVAPPDLPLAIEPEVRVDVP